MPGRYAIGCFGRVRAQKGTDVFVEAMCRLLPRYPDFTAVIVGAIVPEQRGFADDLRKRIEAAGLASRILMTGELPIEEVPRWYQRLTIYAFSSENWRRPAGEIMDLTGLLRRYLRSEIAELKQTGVRMRFTGDRTRFDSDIQGDLEAAERDTAGNSRLNLTIALSYGARAEIAAAAPPERQADREQRQDRCGARSP
ncbi:ditrans,polycis-undecaprenyl-diphosphate synthase [mine drainage metagenome]|uniref:Ditrans,polycis-undecaprenyl-diphosphate synthase n=1 Tax=mine drainage metagenome TaxID=410659 RepID=A0A1J5PSP7_9ZZZZ